MLKIRVKIAVLTIKDFRGHSLKTILLPENMNILYGYNACGKTSVLEAINLLITTRSIKTRDLFDCVSRGRVQTSIEGVFLDKKNKKKALVLISKQNRKNYINGVLVVSDELDKAMIENFRKCALKEYHKNKKKGKQKK